MPKVLNLLSPRTPWRLSYYKLTLSITLENRKLFH